MQFLNKLVEDINYEISHIQKILNQTAEQKLFTVLDLKEGYYQIKVDSKDKHTKLHFISKISYINGRGCHKDLKIHQSSSK